VSGLSYGNPLNGDGVMCAELLLELLCGQAGSNEDQERMSHVVRVIFAGKPSRSVINSDLHFLYPGNSLQTKPNEGLRSRKLRNLESVTKDQLLSTMTRLDDYFAELLVMHL
jgi:hypothetical protein